MIINRLGRTTFSQLEPSLTILELRQEFQAQMMGVRRTSVTEVAQELQKAGMISYARGRVHIINIAQSCGARVRMRFGHQQSLLTDFRGLNIGG